MSNKNERLLVIVTGGQTVCILYKIKLEKIWLTTIGYNKK